SSAGVSCASIARLRLDHGRSGGGWVTCQQRSPSELHQNVEPARIVPFSPQGDGRLVSLASFKKSHAVAGRISRSDRISASLVPYPRRCVVLGKALKSSGLLARETLEGLRDAQVQFSTLPVKQRVQHDLLNECVAERPIAATLRDDALRPRKPSEPLVH